MTSKRYALSVFTGIGTLVAACQTTPDPRPGDSAASGVLTIAPLPEVLRRGDGGTLPENAVVIDYLDRELASLGFPKEPGPKDKEIYDRYSYSADAEWAKEGWLSKLDFSGVSQNFYTAGTLIHPQYIVLAKHMSKSKGSRYSKTVFHDRRTGKYVEREVVDHRDVVYTDPNYGKPGMVVEVNTDVRVCKLNAPVPPGVRHYPLLPPGLPYGKLLEGARVLVLDKDRKVHIMEIAEIATDEVANFACASRQPKRTDLRWWKEMVRGDSGHPSFLYYEGNLVLLETHTTKGPRGLGTAGAFYGNRKVQTALAAAVEEMERN